jgi:hypothetical protein
MQSFASFPIRRAAFICVMLAYAVFFFPKQSHAQGNNGDVTNGGTEFLLCFMANEAPSYDQTTSRYQDIFLASQSDSSIVTITCKAFPNWSRVITLTPHQGLSYRLSTDSIIGYPMQDVLIESDEIITQTVFKVVSTTPIICYGMSHKIFTCDAFLALPRNVASTEYIVMSYANSTQVVGSEMPSEFSVASFDDNDTVTIIPTATTASGASAGFPLTFVLNSGEGVQIQANRLTPMLDLTGSIVRSTKPVVVYGGHQRAEVPVGFINTNGNTSRDHLAEAMPPLSTWGNFFIAKNFGRSAGDLMRVVASMDSTIIKINGVVWGAPLMRRQYRDTIIGEDSTIPSNNIFGVETSSPALVGMIAHTEINGGEGDPFLAIIPPLDQTYHDFTYFISDDKVNFDPKTQYVIVVTEVSGAGAITIDGSVIAKAAYTNVPVLLNGKQYAVATITQSPGSHRSISPNADENGFTILAYGFGNVDSYGYTAGALLKPITGILSTIEEIKSDGKITIRNILTEKVFIDSAIVTYSYNPSKLNVAPKKSISGAMLEMAEQQEIDLAVTSELPGSAAGSLRVYYHTAQWKDLVPVDFPFAIGSQAGVDNSAVQLSSLENFPNPALGRTTIHFNLPGHSFASVKIYDALGRVVRIVAQATMSQGAHSFEVNTFGLPSGTYFIELLAPQIGLTARRSLIVAE